MRLKKLKIMTLHIEESKKLFLNLLQSAISIFKK